MRGLGGLSLVLLALLAALVWAVTWGPLRDISLFRWQTNKAVQPATPVPGPEAQSLSPPKAQRKSGSAKESSPNVPVGDVAGTSEQLPAAAVPPSTPLPLPRFPTAVDVPLGTLGSSILDSFGPPIARTLAVNGNGRIELLIYRRSRPDTTTLIQLRDGRVISAVTTAY